MKILPVCAKETETLVVINGSQNRYAEKAVGDLRAIDHCLVLTDLGIDKLPTLDYREEDVMKMVERVEEEIRGM